MEGISAASLKREMDEMALLLREIQGGARELYDPASEKRTLCSKRLTNDQKRDKSSSSWAKSGVDRKKLFSGEKCCKPETDLTTDVAKSERTIKTRAASHSFGRRYAEVQTIVSDNFHYDVKIESASNRKRVLSSKFSTAVRGDGTTANQNNGDCDVPKDDQMDLSDGGNNTDFDGIADVDNASGSAANKDENISSKKKKIEKGYSRPVPSISSSIVEPSPISFRFPKSSRETVVKKYSGDGVGGVNLDVDSAEKKLHPHIMGTVMKPLTVPRIKNNESENIAVAQAGATSEIKIENNGANIAQKPPASIISNVEVLSSKIRTPAFTMHKDTTKKILNINISNIVKGTPGPGEYELDVIAQSGDKKNVFFPLIVIVFICTYIFK